MVNNINKAPEIANRSGTYDKGSDVYSFGVILLELFFPGYFKHIHNHAKKYTFIITNEHEKSFKSSTDSNKKRQCLETLAKLITECGQSKRYLLLKLKIIFVKTNIYSNCKYTWKSSKDMYGQNEKMQQLLSINGLIVHNSPCPWT